MRRCTQHGWMTETNYHQLNATRLPSDLVHTCWPGVVFSVAQGCCSVAVKKVISFHFSCQRDTRGAERNIRVFDGVHESSRGRRFKDRVVPRTWHAGDPRSAHKGSCSSGGRFARNSRAMVDVAMVPLHGVSATLIDKRQSRTRTAFMCKAPCAPKEDNCVEGTCQGNADVDWRCWFGWWIRLWRRLGFAQASI